MKFLIPRFLANTCLDYLEQYGFNAQLDEDVMVGKRKVYSATEVSENGELWQSVTACRVKKPFIKKEVKGNFE